MSCGRLTTRCPNRSGKCGQQERNPNINRSIGNVNDPNETQLRWVEYVDHHTKSNMVESVSDSSSDD